MPTFELTDDEFTTLCDAFYDVGSECPSVDWDKFKSLGVKFGFWKAEKPPTAEEIARREEFAASPFARQMRELMAASNAQMDKLATANMADNVFFSGTQWANDHTVKETK